MHWNRSNLLKLRKVQGIYIFRNKINGKVYIGQSVDLYMRYGTHVARDNKCIFSNAIKKYGEEGFQFGVLETVKLKKELNKRELYWINFYQSYKRENGYNMHREPCNSRGKKSQEHKDKISKAHLGRKKSKIATKKSLNTRFLLKVKSANIPVEMVDKVSGLVLNIFRSINDACKKTSIPRKSIEAVIQNKYNMKEAGGYLWRKLNIKPTDDLWKIEKICDSYVLNRMMIIFYGWFIYG